MNDAWWGSRSLSFVDFKRFEGLVGFEVLESFERFESLVRFEVLESFERFESLVGFEVLQF